MLSGNNRIIDHFYRHRYQDDKIRGGNNVIYIDSVHPYIFSEKLLDLELAKSVTELYMSSKTSTVFNSTGHNEDLMLFSVYF